MADDEVPKRVEEALFFRLKQRGFRECAAVGQAYAACCKGRVLSIAWACRGEMHDFSECLGSHTSRLPELKQRWIEAGRPDDVDWDKLLDGL